MTRAAEIITLARRFVDRLTENRQRLRESLSPRQDEVSDVDIGDEVYEARPVRIVRVSASGARVRKLDCPPGYRLDGKRCVRMSAATRRHLSKASRIRSRRLRSRRGLINRKRAKAMARRQRLGL